MKRLIIPIILIITISAIAFVVILGNDNLTIASHGKSKYTIIYKDTLADLNNANYLNLEIQRMTGVKLKIRTEETEPDKEGYEIVLGETNRDIDVDTQVLSDFGFIIKTKGNRIHIIGKSSGGTYNGIKYFIKNYIKGKKVTVNKDLNISDDGLSMIISSAETEITIPGLKKEYTFLHITDTHMTVCGDDDNREVRAAANERSNAFKNDDGIMSSERFPNFFLYANKIKADMVLLTGDIADFPTKDNIKILSDSINNSKVNTMYVLGNHDWSFSWDYHSETTKSTYIPLYKDLCNEDPSFQVKKFDDLQIIAVDNSTNQVTLEQYEKTKQQLENGLPTILMMHVPIYIDSLSPDTTKVWGSPILMGPGGISPSDSTKQFYDLITDEDNNVQLIVTGHLHFDHIDEFLPGRKQIVTKVGNGGYCRIIKVKGN